MVHSSLFAGRVSAAASTRFFDFFLPFFFEIGIDVSIDTFLHRLETKIFPSRRNVSSSCRSNRSYYLARIIVPVSEVSRKGIPRSVQLSVSRRCIDDRRPPKYIKDSPNNERLNECCHLSRVFPRYDRVIDFQASKGNTRFFIYITLIKRLHSPRTYRDNINHAEHSNNLIFTRTRYKFISFILPFATSNPCSRVFTTHDCAIGNTILLLRLQKRIEAFSQAERA